MSTINTVKKENNSPIKIYVDFDGTISKGDVLNFILEKYADTTWHDLNKRWLDGKISSHECLTDQVALLKDLPDEKILESAKIIGIDESFKNFCNFCKNKNIDIEIVSDGLDIYINYLLKTNHIKVKKIHSNIYKGKGVVVFPHNKKLCDENCGNCKKSHLDNNYFIIYIGDGYSDRCAAMSSDMVFAKNGLAKYLKTNGKVYVPFRSLVDITDALSDFLSKKILLNNLN